MWRPATATHISMQDMLQWVKKGAAFIPIECYTFLELLASFKALMYTLFGPASPLYLDAEELYKIGLEGNKYRNLRAIKLYQPDWYVHVLWQIYIPTCNYFDNALWLDQLEQGTWLPCPFHHILPTIHMFINYSNSATPPELLPPPLPPPDAPEGKHKPAANGNQVYKKQKPNPTQIRKAQVPQPLFQLQMNVQKHVPQTTLSRILKEAGQDILALIRVTGIPQKTCCCLLFWGACGSPSCSLTHNHIALTPDAIDKVVALLQPGATKILGQPAIVA